MTLDPGVRQRTDELVAEAQVTLDAIRRLAPRTSPTPSRITPTLARAVTSGILDAPHLRNNPFTHGPGCHTHQPATGPTSQWMQ